jgi:hypothetical protein
VNSRYDFYYLNDILLSLAVIALCVAVEGVVVMSIRYWWRQRKVVKWRGIR